MFSLLNQRAYSLREISTEPRSKAGMQGPFERVFAAKRSREPNRRGKTRAALAQTWPCVADELVQISAKGTSRLLVAMKREARWARLAPG
ncbi:hypothetical protein DEA98_24135 [Brucella pseudogrignonensis]|nr:hypothetical protein [Brucella pseudogrignonensis]